MWIFNNLWKKWGGIARRHAAVKATAVQTLALQLSGYGAALPLVQRALDRVKPPFGPVREPSKLEGWGEEEVHAVVDAFVAARFPTVIVLNKCDHEDADANIARICAKYESLEADAGDGIPRVVVASAASECFLRAKVAAGLIAYDGARGDEDFVARADAEEELAQLKEFDLLDNDPAATARLRR